jgi:predicted dehydrogenase
MERELHVAVIGTGMGRYHMEGFTQAANVKLDAVCDLNQAEAEQFAKKYGASHVFTDVRDVLSLKGLDAVGIAIPNYLHASVAIQAMEAGLNVFCEKPMATTLADAERMVATAKRTGKKLMIDMSNRFRPVSQAAHKMLARGEFGDVYYARSCWIRRRGMPVIHFDATGSMGRGAWFVSKEKAGGGALADIGVHVLDLTWWLMGGPKPTRVLASAYRNLCQEEFAKRGVLCDVDELTAAMVKFENGASAFFDVSWAANQEQPFNVRIFGTQGGFELDPPAVHKGEKGAFVDAKVEPTPDDTVTAYRHFIDCLRYPEQPMTASGEECLGVMRMLDGIRRSAESGQEVEIQ